VAATNMEQYISLAKQAGQKISSNEYKQLAIYFYLDNQIEQCRAILPNMTKQDRNLLAKGFGDSSLE
jgi:glutamate formiminotransferase